MILLRCAFFLYVPVLAPCAAVVAIALALEPFDAALESIVGGLPNR